MSHPQSTPAELISNIMRVFIFVDGENFRYAIQNLFPKDYSKSDYLPPNADWKQFFYALAYSAIPEDQKSSWHWHPTIHWYVIRQINYLPHHRCSLHTAKPKMQKRFQGWKEKEDTIAQQYPKIHFQREGSITFQNWKLGSEKGVDVALGRDMVDFSNEYDTAVILSRDADYDPVARFAKNHGKRVLNVEFMKDDDQELAGNSDILMNTVDGTIRIPYQEMKRYMGY